jgi:hypothetical protein
VVCHNVDDIESDRLSTFKKESDSIFDQLFFRSDALTRQLSAPLVDERREYLGRCAAQGMSKCTMRVKARRLLSIAEYLRLAERPNDTITLLEIAQHYKRLRRSRSRDEGQSARNLRDPRRSAEALEKGRGANAVPAKPLLEIMWRSGPFTCIPRRSRVPSAT